MHSIERGGSLAPTGRRASSRGYGKAGRHDRQTAQPRQRLERAAVALRPITINPLPWSDATAFVVARCSVGHEDVCVGDATRQRAEKRHSFIISTSGTRTKRRKSHHHPHDHHVANEEGGSSEISDDPAKTDEHVCTQTTQQ
uniref:Uncharacterized protein n=1 Tax=Plectus sambesii TaxID=2011161 RepID=A0A914VQ74_9BILA